MTYSSEVTLLPHSTSVREALEILRRNRNTSFLVTRLTPDGTAEPLGILGKGEILKLASDRNIDIPVSHAVSGDLITIRSDHDFGSVLKLLQGFGAPHVLVVDQDGHPQGIASEDPLGAMPCPLPFPLA